MQRIINTAVLSSFYLMLACGGIAALMALDEIGSGCKGGQVYGVIWSDGPDGRPQHRQGCITVAGKPVEMWATDERGRPAPVRR